MALSSQRRPFSVDRDSAFSVNGSRKRQPNTNKKKASKTSEAIRVKYRITHADYIAAGLKLLVVIAVLLLIYLIVHSLVEEANPPYIPRTF